MLHVFPPMCSPEWESDNNVRNILRKSKREKFYPAELADRVRRVDNAQYSVQMLPELQPNPMPPPAPFWPFGQYPHSISDDAISPCRRNP
jgi:hypothetical protein